MSAAIFLWVVIIGSSEDHWSRFPMPSTQACQAALITRRVDLPPTPKQVNSVLMFCAGEREMRSDYRKYIQ